MRYGPLRSHHLAANVMVATVQEAVGFAIGMRFNIRAHDALRCVDAVFAPSEHICWCGRNNSIENVFRTGQERRELRASAAHNPDAPATCL